LLDICEDDVVKRDVDDARERWNRAQDAWDALTWVLAHDPKAGRAENESGTIRSITYDGARSIDMPTILAIYEITADKLIIRWTEFTNAKAPNAGRA
jgi:hypothetical protein